MSIASVNIEKSSHDLEILKKKLQNIHNLMVERNFERAQVQSIRMIKEYPLIAQCWLNLAECLDQQAKFHDAWHAYNRAWVLDPEALWASGFQQKYKNVEIIPPTPWLSKILEVQKCSVSAAMIIKDEERTLDRTLKQLQKAVDEIIVVDTGSTDRSIEIAKENGAKVYSYTWNNDFSEARNFALEHVTTDWVLWVDGDEILIDEDIHVVKTACGLFNEFDPPALLRIVIINQIGGITSQNTSVVRLFPTRFGLRWWGRIHEQVGPKEGFDQVSNLFRLPVRLRFWHDGYDPETMTQKDKMKRNIQLLRLKIEQNQNDVDAHSFLGRELSHNGELDEAYGILKKAISLSKQYPKSGRLLESNEYLINVLIKQKNFPEAIETATTIIKEYPDIPNGHFNLGISKLSYAMDLLNQAAEDINESIRIGNSTRGFTRANTEIMSWRGAEILGHIALHQGNLMEAKRLFEIALQAQPNSPNLNAALHHLLNQAREILETANAQIPN